MPGPLKHLLLTTVEDPYSVKSWSGIPYSLRTALEKRVERVTTFTPSKPSRNLIDVLKRMLYGGKPPRYPLWMTKASLKKNAREVQAQIDAVRPEAVLTISSQCVAFLTSPGKPIFLFSDAPWMAWMEAYKGTVSEPIGKEQFAAREAAAARRLQGLCFGSSWANSEAERLYGSEVHDRLHVTPLGANWAPSLSREEILQRAESRPTDKLELLFVGKDWERKGGPLAVEVARLLHTQERPVTLHIVGCRPTLPPDAAAFTEVHGLLYQSDPDQSARLAELFLRSHFLIVPTTAECFGIAFAEAQAFATPPVSRAVHALPTVVADGETGLLFPVDAPATAYADRMSALLNDPEAYRAMTHKARAIFEANLTWDRTAERICDAIDAYLLNS